MERAQLGTKCFSWNSFDHVSAACSRCGVDWYCRNIVVETVSASVWRGEVVASKMDEPRVDLMEYVLYWQ